MATQSNKFGIYVQALLSKGSKSSLQKELNNIKDLKIKVTPEIKRSVTELRKQLKELDNLKIKVDAKLNKIDKKTFKEFYNYVQQQNEKSANDFKKSMGKAIKEVGELEEIYDKNGFPKSKFVETMDIGFYDLFKKTNTEIKITAKEFNMLDNMMSKVYETADGLFGTIGKVLIWDVATKAVYGLRQELAKLIEVYVQIESRLIAIERVTNNFDMSKIFEGAYKSAQKYGASLDDMLDSVEEIARSYGNLNEEQVLAAAEAGILASTIAEMDGKDAVEAIIAVSEAFGFAVEEGEKLIDMANEVDNNFAVTAKDITRAWEKSAATAKTFGVEIEELTGYITAISTVTQETGDVIGNALKTIFSRITTLAAARNAIEGVGVAVYDTTGKVRKAQDIIEDLAEIWDTLSDAQRQNIGVQIAGRYQLTRFLALMNNYDIAVEATTTALNSEGSAAKENAKYLDSYEAKLIQVENAEKELANTINQGNMAGIGKAFLDLKLVLIEVANSFFKISDATTVFLGVGLSLIPFLTKTTNGYKLLANALMFFMEKEKAIIILENIRENGLVKTRIALGLQTAAEKLNTLAKNLNARASAQAVWGSKAHSIALYAESAAAGVCAKAIAWLSAALNTIPGMAFVALLGIIVSALGKVIQKSNEAKKAFDEERASVAQSSTQIKEYVKDLEKLANAKKVMNATQYKSENLEKEQNIIESLADKYTGISDELKDQNHSLEYKLKLIDKENAKLAENTKKEYERAKTLSGANIDTETWHDRKYLDRELTRSEKLTNYWADSPVYEKKSDVAKEFDEVISKGQDYYKIIGDITDAENENINILKEKGIENANTLSEMQKVIKAVEYLGEAYKDADDQGIEPFEKALNMIGLTLEDVNKNLEGQKKTLIDTTDYWTKYKEGIINATTEFENFTNTNSDATEFFFSLGAGYEDAFNRFNEYVNYFGEGSRLVQDQAESLANSISVLGVSLFKNGQELLDNRNKLDLIMDTMEIAKANTMGYSKAVREGTLYVAEGYEAEWEAIRDAKVAELEIEKVSLENKIKLREAELKGINAVGNATTELVEQEKNNAQSEKVTLQLSMNNFYEWAKSIISAKKAVKQEDDSVIQDLRSQLQDINVQIEKWKNIKIVGTTVDKFKELTGATNSASNATAKSINYYNLAEEALRDYSDAVEAIDNELKRLQEQQKRNVKGSSTWFDNYDKQAQVIDRYHKAIDTYIAKIQEQLRNENLDGDAKTKLKNKIEDLRLEYEKLTTTLYDNIEAQKDFYKDEIKDRLEDIKDLEKIRHDEALKNIKKEREAFKKKIDEQISLMKKAKDARSYEQDLNELQEQRLDILKQISRLENDDSRIAQSKLKDLYDKLDDLNKDIDDLNFDRDVEVREDALDELEETLDDYYDKLEEMEDEKHDLITNALDDAKDSLDDLTWTLNGLRDELRRWTDNLSNFTHWADGFDALVSTMPQQNIVTASVPITTIDENGNPVTTEINFQIAGSSKDAQDIATEVVNKLKQTGVITNKN